MTFKNYGELLSYIYDGIPQTEDLLRLNELLISDSNTDTEVIKLDLKHLVYNHIINTLGQKGLIQLGVSEDLKNIHFEVKEKILVVAIERHSAEKYRALRLKEEEHKKKD